MGALLKRRDRRLKYLGNLDLRPSSLERLHAKRLTSRVALLHEEGLCRASVYPQAGVVKA